MIRSDEPIRLPEEDLLGRSELAAVIAGEIRNIDASEGFVVGVLGPWGSGKTSLINLVRAELSTEPALTVVEFNPWMFSGADQLVERFLIELSAQLERGPKKLKEAADLFARYGKILAPLKYVPVAGSLFEGAHDLSEAIKAISGDREGGVAEHRLKLRKGLEKFDLPIVVVIDDIDRLSTSEIRDIFKMVRLTANFPNMIYMVAFDRARVEKALSEDGLQGRDYLEKIIQAAYDIPNVPAFSLQAQLISAINEAIEPIDNPGRFDNDRWPDVLVEIIQPLFRNIRDVRRYAASLPGAIRSLDGKVALVDVLALEAVRVFLPDVFDSIRRNREGLTSPDSGVLTSRFTEPANKNQVENVVKDAGDHRAITEALIERVFPMANRHIGKLPYGAECQSKWARNRRVADPNVLAFYLERVAGEQLTAQWRAEQAYYLLSDAEQLDAHFRSMDSSSWQAVISSLEGYEEDFPLEAAGPATVVLLNLFPELPYRPRGMFDLDPHIVVTRVALRLLRRLPNVDSVEAVVRSAIPEIDNFTGRRILLNLIGHEENVGHRLIREEASAELESSLRRDILASSPRTLAAESELFRLLYWVKATTSASEPEFKVPRDKVLDYALLKAAVGYSRSQGNCSEVG